MNMSLLSSHMYPHTVCDLANCYTIYPTLQTNTKVWPLRQAEMQKGLIYLQCKAISSVELSGGTQLLFNKLKKVFALNNLFDVFQSEFCLNHSTEAALVKFFNNIHLNTDSGRISVLLLLDLSAAFDTADHIILLDRLENWAQRPLELCSFR